MSKQKKFTNGLFIFRRDFGIVDNHGLHLLSQFCEKIFTIFIFTPEQVSSSNEFKSTNAVQFMIESLEDLKKQIGEKSGKLVTFYGSNEKVVLECIQKWKIDLVCFNLDITPYARGRDAEIIHLCEKNKTYVMYDWDYYLHEPDKIMNGSGDPYQKFTPYYETAKKINTY